MRIVIACGNPGSDLEAIFSLLQGAGVDAAKPANDGGKTSIQTWHERLLARYGDLPRQELIQTGKAWEHAASEIFLANWDKAVWGWADSRSTWMLDFWRDFDPQATFVLVHSSPERMLARGIMNVGDSSYDSGSIVESWFAHSTQMLRFYNRNRQRCLLVDAESALANPDRFIQATSELLGCVLNTETALPTLGTDHVNNPLASLLAREILLSHPEVSALDMEIQATAFSCGDRQGPAQAETEEASKALFTAVGQLRDLAYVAGPLADRLRGECERLHDENARQTENLRDFESRLLILEGEYASAVAIAAERQCEIDTLRGREGELLESFERVRNDWEIEKRDIAELAARRLREVDDAFQEEKAAFVLQLDEIQHQLRDQSAEMANLRSVADKQAQLLAEANAELESLGELAAERQKALEIANKQFGEAAKQREKLEQFQRDMQEENELLLLHLHQVQEELERYFLKSQELQRLVDESEQIRGNKRQLIAAHQEEIAALTRARDHNAATVGELRHQLESVTKQKNEKEQLAGAYQGRITELEKEKEELVQARTLHAKALVEKQAQLEQVTSAYSGLKHQVDVLIKEKSELMSARDAQAKLAAVRQAQLEAAESAKSSLERLVAVLQKEKGDLEGARDAQAKLVEERQSQLAAAVAAKSRLEEGVAALQKEMGDLAATRDANIAIAGKVQAQLEAANRRLEETNAQKVDIERAQKDLRQENELLLLQLHQVQEELEHYFLRYQDSQNKLKEQLTRIERIMARHPDYCEWDSIASTAVDESQSSHSVRWQVKGLVVGDRTIPDFEVVTVVNDGSPALIFTREENGASAPFARWPEAARDSRELRLQPRGPEADRSERWGILWGLSSSDWHVAQMLCLALVEYLQSPMSWRDSDVKPNANFWIGQLQALKEQLGLLPSAWRYDGVRLKREQVNPDYEHLWLVLDNAQFGDRRWSSFEFRLGAALIKPGKFSVHPKLEFPLAEDGVKQFENWFEESQDDRGPKFELRFELNSQAMDMAAWDALSPTDQGQLLSIVGRLPSLLSGLEREGMSISRDWNDWQGLAAGVIKVMKARLTEKQAVTAQAPASKSATASKTTRTRKSSADPVAQSV